MKVIIFNIHSNELWYVRTWGGSRCSLCYYSLRDDYIKKQVIKYTICIYREVLLAPANT